MNRLKCRSTSQINFSLHFTVCMKSFLWWSQVPLFRIPAACRLQLTWLHRSLVGRLGNRPLIRSTPCLQHSGLQLLVEPSQVCTLIYDATWTLLKLLLLLLLRHFFPKCCFLSSYSFTPTLLLLVLLLVLLLLLLPPLLLLLLPLLLPSLLRLLLLLLCVFSLLYHSLLLFLLLFLQLI